LTRSDGKAAGACEARPRRAASLNGATTAARLGDADSNDLVVPVWGVTGGPIAGPLAVLLPASLVLVAASVLGGAGWSRFRRA
jgi:hypothetical protein